MISIIVPMYNCADYIDRCITSLITQEYREIEIILVDDGSTDTTAIKCKKYLEQDARIKYFYQDNAGVSSARNTGIQNSSGEYIVFVDSDDWMPCEGINVLHQKITKTDVDFVIASYSRICGNQEEKCIFPNVVIKGQQKVAQEVSDKYLIAAVSSPWAKIYKRELLGDIRFCYGMSLGEDTLFNLNYYSRICSFEIISDIVYYYADENKGSLTNSLKDNTFDAMRKLYCYAKEYFDSIEKKYYCIIDRNNCSYKFMTYSFAYIVRKVENGHNYKDCAGYIRKICSDSVFLESLTRIKKCSLGERVLIIFLKSKCYYAVYFLAQCRAYVRSYLQRGKMR